jgi:hypothetical protein
MSKLILPLGLLALLAACDEAAKDSDENSAAPENLTQAQMPAYCRGEASAKYGGSPQYITALPAEPDNRMLTVYGNTENEAQFFTCTFTSDGRFVGIDDA